MRRKSSENVCMCVRERERERARMIARERDTELPYTTPYPTAKNESPATDTKENNGSLRNTAKSAQTVLARYNCACAGSVVIDDTGGARWQKQKSAEYRRQNLNSTKEAEHTRFQIQFGGFRPRYPIDCSPCAFRCPFCTFPHSLYLCCYSSASVCWWFHGSPVDSIGTAVSRSWLESPPTEPGKQWPPVHSSQRKYATEQQSREYATAVR